MFALFRSANSWSKITNESIRSAALGTTVADFVKQQLPKAISVSGLDSGYYLKTLGTPLRDALDFRNRQSGPEIGKQSTEQFPSLV